jgi:hypothetical protein
LGENVNDLTHLNQCIAEHWLGPLQKNQFQYLEAIRVCIAKLNHSTQTLHRVANNLSAPLTTYTTVTVELNALYLNYVRLAAKDIVAGFVEKWIETGLDWEQTQWLARIDNQQLKRLSEQWEGPIMHFNTQPFIEGAALHPEAAKEHARAYITIII